METVLITGGCGFVGTNLVARLLQSGATVRILDSQLRVRPEVPGFNTIEIVEGDVRDPEVAARAVKDAATVIHLAAAGSVIESIADPIRNFEINAGGTLNMLNASVRAGVKQFIFSSTGGALIGNATPPVNEQSLPQPISPYGASKLCGEAYCHAFAGSYDIRTIALRFANVYGPYSDQKKGAVTKFITSALEEEPMTIFGDGTASRDFLYVDDLCDGILSAIGASLTDDVIHLASGVETPVGELARLVLELTRKSDLPIRYEPGRQGEVYRNFADGAYADEVLDFRPKTSLRVGLKQTIDWFEAHRPTGQVKA